MLRQLSRALRLLTAPLAWVLIYLVRLYQKVLSPILPSACRFRPTCSEYMVEALRKKGFVVGFCLGVWRILRCNPFCRGGYDPVE